MEDELYSTEQLMIMVAKGDIDYAVCDQQIARMTQKKLPEVDILTDSFYPIAIVGRKDFLSYWIA